MLQEPALSSLVSSLMNSKNLWHLFVQELCLSFYKLCFDNMEVPVKCPSGLITLLTKYISWAGSPGRAFLGSWSISKWQENVTFTDSVFSEVFVFLLCAFVSASWSSLTGILVGTQPTVIILVGGNNEWNLVLCSDHLNLVIFRVEPESSLAHVKDD